MKIRVPILLLALLGAPPALAAQRSAPPPAEEVRAAPGGPVDLLLLRRDRIGLRAGQVARLQEIRRRAEERNGPLVARLLEMRRAVRAEFPGAPRDLASARRAEYRRRVEAARPLLREIRENNRAAMREVGRVLTARQKEEVRRMLRESGERRGRGQRSGLHDRGV